MKLVEALYDMLMLTNLIDSPPRCFLFQYGGHDIVFSCLFHPFCYALHDPVAYIDHTKRPTERGGKKEGGRHETKRLMLNLGQTKTGILAPSTKDVFSFSVSKRYYIPLLEFFNWQELIL